MTQNLIDHARILIREEIGKATNIADANAIARVVQRVYPTVDFQSLTAAVIEEVIAARGSVPWGRSDEINDVSSNRMVPYDTHVVQFRTQKNIHIETTALPVMREKGSNHAN